MWKSYSSFREWFHHLLNLSLWRCALWIYFAWEGHCLCDNLGETILCKDAVFKRCMVLFYSSASFTKGIRNCFTFFFVWKQHLCAPSGFRHHPLKIKSDFSNYSDASLWFSASLFPPALIWHAAVFCETATFSIHQQHTGVPLHGCLYQ